MTEEQMRKIISEEVERLLVERFGCIHDYETIKTEDGVYKRCTKCGKHTYDPMLEWFYNQLPASKQSKNELDE